MSLKSINYFSKIECLSCLRCAKLYFQDMKSFFNRGFNDHTYLYLYMKANPKYLPCISICCLFLAVKMCEEDEVLSFCHYLFS